MSQIVLRQLGGRSLTQARSALTQTTCQIYNRAQIGNREVVGFGINGENHYVDHPLFPMQAIRFREPTPEIVAIKEKEKGDWKKLTIDEKKTLYRASFCQTYAEMNAPTGNWKIALGTVFLGLTFGLCYLIFMRFYVYGPLPESFSEESQRAQLKRMIDMRAGAVEGIASKWDYENNRWK